MIKCVLFDLDGTLVDVGELFYHVFMEFLARQGLPAIGFNRKGDPWASAYEWAVSRFPWISKMVGGKSFGDAWEYVLRARIASGEIKLYPGVLDTLTHLREKNKTLCLATNTPSRFVEIKLDAFALRNFFECIFTPHDIWGAKPNPKSLHYVLERFRLTPHEVLVVGDHAQDVQFGKNAGVRTAAVLTGYGSLEELKAANPDYLIRDVCQVLTIVEESGAAGHVE